MDGFKCDIDLPFDGKDGINNPTYSKEGSEYLTNEWLRRLALWSPSSVVIAEKIVGIKMAKSNQYAEGIVKCEEHYVNIDQNIKEPATYRYYRFEDLCNSAKVLVTEVGGLDNIINRRKKRKIVNMEKDAQKEDEENSIDIKRARGPLVWDSRQHELKLLLETTLISTELSKNTHKYNSIKEHAVTIDKQFMSYFSFNNFINGTRTSTKSIKSEHICVIELFCNKKYYT